MKKIDLERIKDILETFKDRKILVYGDLMIDEFIFSDVKRISPEAPVPVAEVIEKNYRLGGASNVAANIVSLGGKACMAGLVGDDGFGRLFSESASEQGIDVSCIVKDEDRPTTVKTRILAQNQQIARVDSEKRHAMSHEIKEKMKRKLSENIDKYEAVIISDYAKGAFNIDISDFIKNICNQKGIITAVDPKIRSEELYSGIDYLKPNLREAQMLAGLEIKDEDSLQLAGKTLLERMKAKVVVLTRGKDGISVFQKDKRFDIPTQARKVYDVTGAGDTTIATLIMAILSGADIMEASLIANIAAGIVVGEVGTAKATCDDILSHCSEYEEEICCFQKK
ncbi:MAG: D-glycero-beta-D-manno-heptose-7-phosphate kinase [Candidatus Muiribacterium halophilum]|uniref:D-glycero-beta-D-manno-heptose-7-phosphate kinase n=1 Tax=Muiribacterium halophilum TaxID=2053465 RepID=A0A2N5ZK25_MUIH1|nr:MAG: D-glycero-beta-D-manno-heptose-7-phosphate kinase [Candidatus Muirbacterium halophilum]